ncbi:hypothetical protein L210DRAFT_987101 [Boletus edulis BED1]|uniref:Uncharacterized protein n=1 Tax=Boletus edulis BED1 TaxID=1328754 RepID=A0AAD4G814_BOLED|nr:hypothetical protein L210DRAFT_987101 [Boletus edulis BED1]
MFDAPSSTSSRTTCRKTSPTSLAPSTNVSSATGSTGYGRDSNTYARPPSIGPLASLESYSLLRVVRFGHPSKAIHPLSLEEFQASRPLRNDTAPILRPPRLVHGIIGHIDSNTHFSASFQLLAAYFSTTKCRHLDDRPKIPMAFPNYGTRATSLLRFEDCPTSQEKRRQAPAMPCFFCHSTDPSSSASHEHPRLQLPVTLLRGIPGDAPTRSALLGDRYGEPSWERLLDKAHPEPGGSSIYYGWGIRIGGKARRRR